MSQGWRGLVPGVLAGTATVAIVVSYQQAALALSFAEVRKIAVPVTVMISAQNGGGSGVIVAKQGSTYTVLTNRHVAEEDTAYRIQTSDNDVHEQVKLVKRFQDVDLAVLQFDSAKNYPVATLGNSGLSSVGDTVFSFGYPAIYDRPTGKTEQKYYDAEGIILALDAKDDQGYVIKHRADTPRGMSGGPSFDAKGRLIAINGRHGEAFEFRDSVTAPVVDKRGEISDTGRAYVQVYNGEWFSIPINTVLERLSSTGVNVSNLKIDKTPPPNNRERIANPKNAGDFYLCASISRQKGDIETAISDYNKAIRLDSDFIDAYMSRGIAFVIAKAPLKAISDFDEIIARPSGDFKMYAYTNRGVVRFNLGDKQGAIKDFAQAIRLDPKNAVAAYNNRGAVRFNLGDKQGAIEDFAQAIRLDPKYASAYHNQGAVRADLGDKRGAIEDFAQAIRLDPKYASAYHNRGDVRADLGDRQGAIEDYTQAIRLNPKGAYAYNNRGTVRFNLGDKRGAIEDFAQAIRLDPKYASAYHRRGDVRADLGDRQGAIKDYTQAIRLDPKGAYAYTNRGVVRADLGDKQGAIEDYTQAIRLAPKDAAAYYSRGAARADLGDRQGAIADYTQAIRLNPKHVSAYNNRGAVRLNLGDRQGAIEDYTQAIRLDSKKASAYKNRGIVRSELNDKRGAIEDFREAASLYLEQKDMDSYNALLRAIKALQSS